jgi:hypothetical protein
MSTTIAHRRHHVHVPWPTILAVIFTALIAAAVIWALNQPTSITTGTRAVPTALAAPAAVPLPETLAARRVALENGPAEPFAYPRNHVPGVTLDAVSTQPAVPPVDGNIPQDQYPHNHFPGEP